MTLTVDDFIRITSARKPTINLPLAAVIPTHPARSGHGSPDVICIRNGDWIVGAAASRDIKIVGQDRAADPRAAIGNVDDAREADVDLVVVLQCHVELYRRSVVSNTEEPRHAARANSPILFEADGLWFCVMWMPQRPSV